MYLLNDSIIKKQTKDEIFMAISGTRKISEDLKNILICVDSYEDKLISGRIYNGFWNKEIPFNNLYQMLFCIINILDKMNFPLSATEKRTFVNIDNDTFEMPQSKNEQSEEYSLGKLATFNIKVLFRQKSCWQGSIAWIEGKCANSFRSTLEMLMLIDNAITSLDCSFSLEENYEIMSS